MLVVPKGGDLQSSEFILFLLQLTKLAKGKTLKHKATAGQQM